MSRLIETPALGIGDLHAKLCVLDRLARYPGLGCDARMLANILADAGRLAGG
jgi:hypothetical protein